MKILLLNDFCKEGGGAETYIFAIAKILSKKHKISLFGYGNKEERTIERRVIKHPKSKIKKAIGKFIFNPKIYFALRKHINDFKPDLIFLHNNYIYSLPILLALKKEKIPTVQTMHDWGMICPSSWCVIKKNLKECKGVEGISWKCLYKGCIKPKHFFVTYVRNKLRIKLTRKIINQFISPSKKLAKDLKEHDFKNVHCIHHFKEFNKSKLDFSKSKKNLILYVGVLSKNKGVDFLIKAFKNIVKNNPKAKLHIVGDGPERKELEKLTKKLNLTNKIEFKGKIPHKNVLEEFNQCRLFVIPSIWMENSPFVIYECMSAGRPIVGSNRGGIPDLIINNETGFLVEPANSEEICSAVIKILNNENLFKRFGKRAFERVHNELNKKHHLKKLEKVLEKTIE